MLSGSYAKDTPTVESLLQKAGGCGLFQILIVIAFYTSFVPIVWSGMFMAYGNYNPGWTCLDDVNTTKLSNKNFSFDSDVMARNGSTSEESCAPFDLCQRVKFKTDVTTLVTEWGLVCSRSWIPSFMISLQMAGVIIGSCAGGRISDSFGRTFVLYGAVLLNGIFSFVAAFSVNWEMFAALKLLLGVVIGAFLSIFSSLVAEFVTIRWRGILATAPIWGTGSVTFAIAAMIIKDWKYLHIANGCFSFIMCLCAFWVPESMRWLATRNKLDKARNVAKKIARTNRKPLPDLKALEIISQMERQGQYEEAAKTYVVLDLFRKGLYKRTCILVFVWSTMVVVYYAIGFSVKALSGNFFLNLILFPITTVMPYPLIPLIANKIGRKWGMIVFFGITASCCYAIVLVQFVAPSDVRGTCITALALLTFCSIESGWNIALVYTVELFPTVVRGMGFGFVCGSSRIGGIAAPYLIPNDESSLYISYCVMGGLVVVSVLLILTLPETNRRPLQDNIRSREILAMKSPLSDDTAMA